MIDIYKHIDRWAEAARKKFTIVCEKQCTQCCYILNVVHLQETICILSSKEGYELFCLHKKDLKKESNLFFKKDPKMTVSRYVDQMKPCPFLSAHGVCRIYDVRPVSCRTHLSFTKCTWNRQDKRIVLDPRKVRNDIWQYFIDEERSGGLPFRPAPLAVGLFMAEAYINDGIQGLVNKYGGSILDQLSWLENWIWLELDRDDLS